LLSKRSPEILNLCYFGVSFSLSARRNLAKAIFSGDDGFALA
jgi:hypothetical protein